MVWEIDEDEKDGWLTIQSSPQRLQLCQHILRLHCWRLCCLQSPASQLQRAKHPRHSARCGHKCFCLQAILRRILRRLWSLNLLAIWVASIHVSALLYFLTIAFRFSSHSCRSICRFDGPTQLVGARTRCAGARNKWRLDVGSRIIATTEHAQIIERDTRVSAVVEGYHPVVIRLNILNTELGRQCKQISAGN